jgi:hypothetical protein
VKRFICERQTRHAYVSAMAAERGIPGLLAVLWLIGKALVDPYISCGARERPRRPTSFCTSRLQ